MIKMVNHKTGEEREIDDMDLVRRKMFTRNGFVLVEPEAEKLVKKSKSKKAEPKDDDVFLD